MVITSRTGLIAGIIRPVQRFIQNNEPIELKTVARPAHFNLKPLSGLFNPYPKGCSLLCNHPTPELPVPVTKDASGFHPIPMKYEQIDNEELDTMPETRAVHTGSVPEELFRRYTQTDSRPLTPTPTVASATTLSAPRRCVTPQPTQRPKLIVDLRRTHSQETISWAAHSEHGLSTLTGKSPRSSNASSHSSAATTISAAVPAVQPSPATTPRVKHTKKVAKTEPTSDTLQVDYNQFLPELETTEDLTDDAEDAPRRRGKRKKARSRVGTALKTSDKDPETQIASMGLDAQDDENNSQQMDDMNGEVTIPVPELNPMSMKGVTESFLDQTVIRVLQRELDQEVIDTEFDTKKKAALEEAFRCLGRKRVPSAIPQGWSTTETDINLWLTLPRMFSRSSARFEIPLDTDELESLTSMEYIRNYVTVTGPRMVLFNFVFNRHKVNLDDEGERYMLHEKILTGLGEVMGAPLSEKQSSYMENLLNWTESDRIDFRIWTGICALCERLLAPQYCPQYKNNIQDPCSEIERADFETLHRKLYGLNVDKNLVEILTTIRNI